MTEPVRKVVIVGGGTAGWMSAAVLAQVFGPALDIQLVESEEIGSVGVGEATIPQIRLLLGLLGVDENEFLRATNGTFKLGIQFNDWLGDGRSYMHAFGDVGRPLGRLPFQHYWLRARAGGFGGSLWDYSFNFQAARNNRYDRIGPSEQTGLDGLVHAYHFDASRVAVYLRGYAEGRGVLRVEGRVTGVEREAGSGHLRELLLADGRRLAGELFIDCSGFRGLLIGESLGVAYQDWSRWLPCDAAVAVQCAAREPLRPYTEATAREAGWQWRIPLQNRTGNGLVYCSTYMDQDRATRALLDGLDGAPAGEPRPLRFTTGRRDCFWSGNCVALGLAGGFMEPLESTSIHLVQTGLDRLLKLFPDASFNPVLASEYNRQTTFEYERIRDFLVLHYHANRRTGQPFWDACRDMPVPDSLAARMALFQATGNLLREGDELFHEVGWLQVLVGQGVEPHAWHPLVQRVSDEQLARWLANLKVVVDGSARELPGHAEYIRRHCAA